MLGRLNIVGHELRYTNARDLEERRMRIAQIYACILLYFLLKVGVFDVPPELSKWW